MKQKLLFCALFFTLFCVNEAAFAQTYTWTGYPANAAAWNPSANFNVTTSTAGGGSFDRRESGTVATSPISSSSGDVASGCGSYAGLRLEMSGSGNSAGTAVWNNSTTVTINFPTYLCAPVTFNVYDITEKFWNDGTNNWVEYQDKVSISALNDVNAAVLPTATISGGIDNLIVGSSRVLVANGMGGACNTQAVSVGTAGQLIKQITIVYSSQDLPTHCAPCISPYRYGISQYQYCFISPITSGGPTASIAAGPVACGTANTTLTASTSAGSPTYSWTGPGTITSPTSASTAVSGAGTYTVTVSQGSCTATATYNVTANTPPTPTFNAVSPVCSGSASPLPATSTNGISGTWSPAFNNTTTTIYTFTPNVGQCGTTTTMTVTVIAPATANAGTDITGCSNNVTLSATSSGGAGTFNTSYVNNTPVTIVDKTIIGTMTISSINMSSAGVGPTATLASICYTLDHGRQTDIKWAGVGSTVRLTAPNLLTYICAVTPVVTGSGSKTYCITLPAITGTMSGNWQVSMRDELNGGNGAINKITNLTVTFTTERISWSPTTNMTGANTLTPTINPAPAGTTVYTMTTYNASGCTTSDPISVTVAGVAPTAVISGSGSFCAGNPLASISFTGASPWTVTYSDGVTPVTVTTSSNPFTFVPASAATYTITTLINSCATITAPSASLTGSANFSGGSSTWNGSAWSNGVPTLGTNVIINGTYDMATQASFDGCNLTVNNPYVLTITANKYVNIQNNITVNAGATLDVLNNGSIVQISDAGINTGNIIMRRSVNMRLWDYVYWSSPVAAFPVTSISTLTPSGYIWKWDPVGANTQGGLGNWLNTTENMVNAKGYIVRGPSGFTSTPASFTTAFTGVPNNGVITAPIQRGNNLGSGSAGPNGIMRTDLDDNWNLVGNPYPSSIKAVDFLNNPLNSNVDGAIRIWTHNTLPSTGIIDPFYGNYVSNYTTIDYFTYNSLGASSGPAFNGNIAAGQAFLVLMNAGGAGSATVTFNNALRNKTYDNTNFYKNATSGTERHRIWLDLASSNGTTNRTLVGYADGATQRRDRMFDAITDYKNAQNFYSLIDDEVMLIQGRALPFMKEDKVPMGIKIPASDTYKISIAAVEGIFEGGVQTIYLEDKLANVIHDLTTAPYQFTADKGVINDRFVLRYTKDNLNSDDAVQVIANENVTVYSVNERIKDVMVYDIIGQKVREYHNIGENQFALKNLNRTTNMLMMKITLENGKTVIQKIMY